MANEGSSPRTGAQEQQLAVTQQQLGPVLFFGTPEFDGTPGAQEIYAGGVEGNRFNIPNNSYVFGFIVASAWNETDNTTPAGAVIYFGVENVNNTVSVSPVNIRATDGNPINEFDAGVGTWALSADDTNKAIALTFTGTANKKYDVQATMYYAVAGSNFRRPNSFGTIT